MSLTLHFHPLSSFCWKALIALYENDTPFAPNMVDLGNAAERAALLKLWPIGKFPVLRDDARDQTVPESSIIIEYLDRHYPGHTQFIPADPDLASMALRQIIDNGLKYSWPATELAVAAEAHADSVTIRVRDQGPGIPDGERTRIFDRFYRRQSAKERVPGSGMGLYIAREIARAHGGDLWVESQPGSGSEFCLTLPTQQESAPS